MFVERASFESYLPVISACLVFIFFGFSNDSLAFYTRWYGKVMQLFKSKGKTEASAQIATVTDKLSLVNRSERCVYHAVI